jgi:hypothetical protein
MTPTGPGASGDGGGMSPRWLAALTVTAALAGCGTAPMVSAQDAADPQPGRAPGGSEPAPWEPPAATPAKGTGRWAPAQAWPYAPWSSAAVPVWTGAEVLVLATPVAGAYDPATGTWRRLTAPRVAVTAAVLGRGGVVYALADGQLWSYAVGTDSWRRLADPPGKWGTPRYLTAASGTIAAWFDGAVQPVLLYDVAAGRWRVAPGTPWGPYESRSVVGLLDGRLVVVEAPAEVPDPPTAEEMRQACGGPCPQDGWVVTGRESRGPSAENPAPRWRAAVLAPGASRWRALQQPRLVAGRHNSGA